MSMFWYKANPQLLDGEKQAMRMAKFDHFTLDTEADGRLSWTGQFCNKSYNPQGNPYIIQAVYEHDHPNNDSYGGSVKVYLIEPDLEKVQERIGKSIPHTLRDSADSLYLCTADKEDFQVSKSCSTSAASALAWAAKWIFLYEGWLNKDISDSEFRDDNF